MKATAVKSRVSVTARRSAGDEESTENAVNDRISIRNCKKMVLACQLQEAGCDRICDKISGKGRPRFYHIPKIFLVKMTTTIMIFKQKRFHTKK